MGIRRRNPSTLVPSYRREFRKRVSSIVQVVSRDWLGGDKPAFLEWALPTNEPAEEVVIKCAAPAVIGRRDHIQSVVRRVETAPDQEGLRRALEPLGLHETVLTIDPKALDALIESRTLPPSIEDALLASRETVRTTKALYLKDADRTRR